MPPDEPMPPQPKTTDLPAATLADIRHAELKNLITASIGALDAKVALGFQRAEAHVGAVADQVSATKNRVIALESRVGVLEGRAERTSDSVKGQSNADLAHEAQIAAEIVARQKLGEDLAVVKGDVADMKDSNVVQLEILQRLDKVFQNKAVKLILLALGIIAAGWLASHGINIGAGGVK